MGDWQEVSRKKKNYRSKEDDVSKISTSIYITNFPESFTAKDLFHSCKVYGHVVDSYIPFKRSKAVPLAAESTPAIVLDSDCLYTEELCNSVLGRVKEFASLSNLRTALINEGFAEFNIRYMGELWVSVDFGGFLISWMRLEDDGWSHMSTQKGIDLSTELSRLRAPYEVLNSIEQERHFKMDNNGDEHSTTPRHKEEKLGGSMNCLSLNIQGLAQKAKKDWVKDLCIKHKDFSDAQSAWEIDNIRLAVVSSKTPVSLIGGTFRLSRAIHMTLGVLGYCPCGSSQSLKLFSKASSTLCGGKSPLDQFHE
ncbi:nucleotide-binding alpha-beta plait domain-containing protein [Tanacetum coccineum]